MPHGGSWFQERKGGMSREDRRGSTAKERIDREASVSKRWTGPSQPNTIWVWAGVLLLGCAASLSGRKPVPHLPVGTCGSTCYLPLAGEDSSGASKVKGSLSVYNNPRTLQLSLISKSKWLDLYFRALLSRLCTSSLTGLSSSRFGLESWS